MTENQRHAAVKDLSVLSREVAQALLDELGWRMDAGGIRTSPLAYLQGMVRHAMAGTFEPTAPTPRLSDRDRVGRTFGHGEAAAAERPRPPAPIYDDVDRNPLCQRAADIPRRALQEKAAAATENPLPAQDLLPGAAAPEPVPQAPPSESKPFAYLRSVIGK